jgi:hypothetical protein
LFGLIFAELQFWQKQIKGGIYKFFL